MRTRKGFTLIELLVVISIIALLIGILLPALGAARRTARQMQSNTHVRGMGQGLVMYAQSNNTYYPGISSKNNILVDGTPAGDEIGPYPSWIDTGDTGAFPAARYVLLITRNYFNIDYVISPVETKALFSSDSTNAFDTGNFSYAMLRISDSNTGSTKAAGLITAEWRETINAQAIVISDRNTGQGVTTTAGANSIGSLHTEDQSGQWRGSTAYNDNHVEFSTTPRIAITKYGNGENNTNDNLFMDTQPGDTTADVTGQANAFMVYQDAIQNTAQN